MTNFRGFFENKSTDKLLKGGKPFIVIAAVLT
jgi:hypothetical protein